MATTTSPRDEQLFRESRRMALSVDFIETVEEFRFYSRALYVALLWAKKDSKEQPEKETEWWQTISQR